MGNIGLDRGITIGPCALLGFVVRQRTAHTVNTGSLSLAEKLH